MILFGDVDPLTYCLLLIFFKLVNFIRYGHNMELSINKLRLHLLRYYFANCHALFWVGCPFGSVFLNPGFPGFYLLLKIGAFTFLSKLRKMVKRI